MQPLVDTHAHLCDAAFASDLDDVLHRARSAGVAAVVAVGEDIADARRNLELADRHGDLVRPAAGLFPTRLDLAEADELIAFMRDNGSRWAAIGEVGLDYWKVQSEEERAVQRDIFRRFMALAAELDLPLNVHSRSAGRHAIELLIASGARRVQMHAFDGRAASAMPGVEAGFFFSVPPSVVRSPQKQKLVRRLPLGSLLAETDSPVLGSVPGERNEPRAAALVLDAIAEIKATSRQEVGESLWENTRRLYGTAVVPARHE